MRSPGSSNTDAREKSRRANRGASPRKNTRGIVAARGQQADEVEYDSRPRPHRGRQSHRVAFPTSTDQRNYAVEHNRVPGTPEREPRRCQLQNRFQASDPSAPVSSSAYPPSTLAGVYPKFAPTRTKIRGTTRGL